jgi:signal transduction histidine kinase
VAEEQAAPLVRSLRVRLAVVTVVIVAVVFTITAVGLMALERQTLLANQTGKLRSEAAAVALAVGEGRPMPTDLPPNYGVQVVSASGSVEAGTDSLREKPPISTVQPRLDSTEEVPLTLSSLRGDDGVDEIMATTVATPEGQRTIFVAAYGSLVERSVRTLGVGLAVAFSVVLFVTGILAWLLTGRTLRSVELLRAEVASLAEDDLSRRVRVPTGDEELARLASTLNDLLARIEAAEQARRAFVSDASHELRSPIASLLTTIDVARAHPERADWGDVARAVSVEGQRLSRLVDDLLLLASRDEGRSSAPHQAVDLEEICFSEVDRLRSQGTVVVRGSQIGPARVLGDPDELFRAVRNLVDNAVRHASTSVTISLRTEDGDAVLVVADDGPGVDPATAADLFHRFTRADEARARPHGGAGLGLAIVAAIAASHEGTVRFLEVERGASVELRLPLVAA